MTCIKICGLTRAEDAAEAARLGADMLGFIHVRKSPRFVDVARLRELLAAAAGKARRVLVVQDLPEAELAALRRELDFEDFQFHGDEPPHIVRAHGGYKVFHIRDRKPEQALLDAYGSPFLLDTQVGSQRGGSGVSFDWSVLPEIRGEVIVAGGLEPLNAARLTRDYRPWGVDVSSGVEAAPGVKDHRKLAEFIENVRRATAS